MVLVEIFDLIVDINRSLHGIFDFKSSCAGRVILAVSRCSRSRTIKIISVNMFLDLSCFYEQDNSKEEENTSEDPESHYLSEET